jgi:hypothetical protein
VPCCGQVTRPTAQGTSLRPHLARHRGVKGKNYAGVLGRSFAAAAVGKGGEQAPASASGQALRRHSEGSSAPRRRLPPHAQRPLLQVAIVAIFADLCDMVYVDDVCVLLLRLVCCREI